MSAASDGVGGGAGFYDLPSDEQVAGLRLLLVDGLAAWDLGEVDDVELLAERENAVFSVASTRGRFAARVHRAGYHDDAQLRSQVDWMRALRDEGVVDTADVVDTASGDVFTTVEHPAVPESRQVSLLEWVDGEQLSARLGDATPAEVVAAYERQGALMAALHRHGARWVRPEGFSCFTWDVDGLLGDDPVWGRFWQLPGLDATDQGLLTAFRAQATAELRALPSGPEHVGLCHNDFLAENLLVHGDGLTLLDFDDCGDGWFLFDLCPALASVATRDDYAAVRAAFVEGYRSVRPLRDEDLAHLPLLFAVRMATYAAWLDTRRHTQFARDLGELIVAAAVDVIRRYAEGTLEI